MEPLNTSIECVLFDLDGTLVDTAPDFQIVLDHMLDRAVLPRVTSDQLHQTVSDGARALVKLAFGHAETSPEFALCLQELLDLYYEQLAHSQARPYPGIPELLDRLETSAIAWGVVTNKPEKYSIRLLASLGLHGRCRSLVCPEHVSHSKPNPEPLLLACNQLGRNMERTVYIGDHLRDMQAAKNADIIAIAAAYGYLSAGTRLDQWCADFVVTAPGDIPRLLESLKFR